MAEEKTHQPTQKKKDQARKDGKVIKSAIVAQACIFILLNLAILIFGSVVNEEFTSLTSYCWISKENNLLPCVNQGGLLLFKVSLIVLLMSSLTGLGIELFQVGWKPEFSLLIPKGERFNIASGFKKIFSNWKELLQLVLKITIWLLAFVYFIKSAILKLAQSISLDAQIVSRATKELTVKAMFIISICWIILAIYDYWRNRKKYYKK